MITNFENAIIEHMKGTIEAELENIDFDEMSNDIAAEMLEDYIGDLRDEVYARLKEYAKQKINYEATVDSMIQDYIDDKEYRI